MPTEVHSLVRLRPFALLLSLSLSLAAIACGGDDDSASGFVASIPVTSGDTTATLDIPEGALPSDISPDDITVTPLEITETIEDSEHLEPLAAYRFEPAGAEFEIPLRLSIDTVAQQEQNLIARLGSGDGSSELLQPVALSINLATNRVTAVYSIEHFSEILFMLSKDGAQPHIAILPPPPEETYLVGESFTVRARLHSGYANWTVVSRNDDGLTIREDRRTLREKPWHADVVWSTSAPTTNNIADVFVDALNSAFWGAGDDDLDLRNDPPLEPRLVESSVDGSTTLTAQFIEQTFTCKSVGFFTIWVFAKVQATAELKVSAEGYSDSISEYTQKMHTVFPPRIVGQCIAPAVTETPTPDPTTELTETPTPDPTTDPTSEPTDDPTSEPTEGPTASPSPSPSPTATGGPTSAPPSDGLEASLGDTAPEGSVLVFLLDGIFFDPAGLSVVEAHEPFCSYEHVHGGLIQSIIPGSSGNYVTRTEHLGECGFGPPAFYVIPDPR